MSETLTAKIPRMNSPVNRLAASVIRPGVHYEEKFQPKNEMVSDTPFPMRSYPNTSKPEDNLTGLKIGRFTVVGLSLNSPSWVVRCACGRYCYRKAKALKVKELEGAISVMCPRCAHNVERKPAIDIHKKNLHAASFPLYCALQEIITNGLNQGTRERAREAMELAEGKSETGRTWLDEIHKKKAEGE
jgi:hypothetical protein